MTDFINFIKEYGIYILTSLSILIEIIIIFVKKNPKTLDDFLDCLHRVTALLPGLITEFECPGHGAEKKQKVLDQALTFLKHLLGRDLSKGEKELFDKTMSDQIEVILSTPTKKEDKLCL